MNNYKSPLTEINKDSTPLRRTRSARPQEGWVNPLFRGKDYSGPKEYRDPNDEQGWTLMEKIQQIVGTKDFKIFGEVKNFSYICIKQNKNYGDKISNI